MKICLVLLASLVVVAYGHKTDGGSYAAKKAEKLSLKESLTDKIHNFKDKIYAKIATKKAKIHAKKAQKHGDLNLEKGAQPAVDCSTVMDEVWEERCDTKYEPVCRMEMQPDCTTIQAKECAPESQTRCSFVFEDKCKTISVPKCTIDWEKRCTSTPDCTTIEAKTCTEVEKDVCVTHMDKICTMSTVNVCRKVAIREFTPEDDAVERVGLKASIKAKAAAHKAHKAQIKAEKLALKGDRAYTPEVDTVERVGLKASIKAKAAAHKALKKEKIAEKLVSKAHSIFKRSSENELENEPKNEPKNEPVNEPRNDPENEGQIADEHGIHKRSSDDNSSPGCKSPKFSCDLGRHCLDPTKVCDGKIDCVDASDEKTTECIELREEWAIGNYTDQDYWDIVNSSSDDEPDETTPKPVNSHIKANCDPECLREEAYNDCLIKKTDYDINQRKAVVVNKQNRINACKGIKDCDEKENEWRYPTTIVDVEPMFNCSQYKSMKMKDRDQELEEIKRELEDCKKEQEFLLDEIEKLRNQIDDENENRKKRSLKGEDAGDFKGRLETFKAGFKAAKAQYHEAKAQFKATTKALIHAKLNKGPKGEKGLKGLKASVPTIKVRYEKSCQDEPRQICTQTPRQECHKEVVPLCKTEPKETCVQKERCKSWPKKNCMIHKETCLPFPTKKCTEISTPVCRVVPRQECTEKKHEICETVPTKDCQKVLVSKPRTVCVPRPTSRTIEDW